MSKTLNNIELRSQEVQEILTRIPPWIIQWGSSLFFIIILLVLALCWVIKYPDIIDTSAVITTQTPPQKEYAKISGRLDSIFVDDSQLVNRNEVLAIIEQSADVADVYYLKSMLDTLDLDKRQINFPINEIPILILGDIEMAYANFENSYTEYELNMALNPYDNESVANKVTLDEQRIQLQNMQLQYSLNESEFQLKKKDLIRNKSLLEKGVISQLDYENKQLELLNAEKNIKSLEASISQTRESIANASKNLKGTKFTRTREEAKLLRNTLQAFNQLKKAIRDWENLYVLKSEIEGRISFHDYWSSNQTVIEGDLVFTIIPQENDEYIAKLKAAAQNSGKIKTGQKVNIKLQNFPETEFGMIRGAVESISLTPDSEGFYLINVSLPNKLLTSYNKEIEFRQEMIGNAEIITEDLRLIERLFYQFKQIFDR